MSREGRRELPGHVLVTGEAERALVARPHETLLVGRVRRVAVDAALLNGLVGVGLRGGELDRRVAPDAKVRRLGGHLLRRARARRVAACARREDLVGLGPDEPGLLRGVRVVAVHTIGVGRHQTLVRLRDLGALDVVALQAERPGRGEELVGLRRRVRVVAGGAVAFAEGTVDRLRGEERLLLRVTGEAQVAAFLDEPFRVGSRVRVVALDTLAVLDGSVDGLFGEVRLDRRVAADAKGRSGFVDEVSFLRGVRRVAGGALALPGRGVGPDRLLEALREIGVAGRAQLGGLARQCRRRRRLLGGGGRFVAGGAVPIGERRMADRVQEPFLARDVRIVAGEAVRLRDRVALVRLDEGGLFHLVTARAELLHGLDEKGGLPRRVAGVAVEALSFGDRLMQGGLLLLQARVELRVAGEAEQADVVRQEGRVPGAVRVVAALAGARAHGLVDGARLRKVGRDRRVVAVLAEGAGLVLEEARAARRVRVVAGVAGALGKRAVRLARRRLPPLLHVGMAGEAQLSGRLGEKLRLVCRVRVVAARAGALAHRGVHEGLGELRLLRGVAGIAELPSRAGRELGLPSAVRHVARGALTRLRRRVDDFLRQPLLGLGVAARAGRDARGLEQFLPGGGVRVVAGGAVPAFEGVVNDRLFQFRLLVRVAVEAELRLLGLERQCAGCFVRRSLGGGGVAGRAVRGGSVDDLAEERALGGRVR